MGYLLDKQDGPPPLIADFGERRDVHAAPDGLATAVDGVYVNGLVLRAPG